MLEWVGHYVDLDYMLWVRTQRTKRCVTFSNPGEMAAFPNYFDLCDSPNGSPHPHLCVLPLPLHLPGAQEEADKVIGILLGLKRNFFLQEGWWVGGAGRDIFRPLLGSWQVIHWRPCSRKCG